MTPRKQAAVQEPPIEEQPTYQLEPVTDDIRSRLTVWGNSTRLTITQLETVAPGWAAFLHDIFVTVGGLMETTE